MLNVVNIIVFSLSPPPPNHIEKIIALHLNKLEFPLPEDICLRCVKCLVEIGLGYFLIMEEFKILDFVHVLPLSQYHLPLQRDMPLHLNKLESPSTKDYMCQLSWLKLAWCFWGRFLNFVNITSLFRYFSPLEII